MSRDEVKSLIKFPNYGQENPAHKVSQEQEVKMVWDPYQVEILGISILSNKGKIVKQKESWYFWMNSSGEKELLKHRFFTQQRNKAFGDAL